MSFTMTSGDSKRINFSINDKDGVPLDITGAIAQFWASKLKNGKFSSTPVITKSSANGGGITMTDAFSGALTVRLEPEDTDGLAGEYYVELQLVDVTGDVATAYTGTMTVLKDLIAPEVLP